MGRWWPKWAPTTPRTSWRPCCATWGRPCRCAPAGARRARRPSPPLGVYARHATPAGTSQSLDCEPAHWSGWLCKHTCGPLPLCAIFIFRSAPQAALYRRVSRFFPAPLQVLDVRVACVYGTGLPTPELVIHKPVPAEDAEEAAAAAPAPYLAPLAAPAPSLVGVRHRHLPGHGLCMVHRAPAVPLHLSLATSVLVPQLQLISEQLNRSKAARPYLVGAVP